jgi:rSAM/selenodomain-associated transferase 1
MAAQKRLFIPGADTPVKPVSHALVIMAKAPISGAVKSRLVPPLTEDEAAGLNRCFIRDICASIEAAAATVADASGARVAGMVAYMPVGMEAAFDGLLPASFELIAQRGDGLTERLINVADDLLGAGYESVALMNSDSPTIPASILANAVGNLAQSGDRIAIVGADDGGYCLIGLKRPHWRIFEDIAWSTAVVFAQTLERVGELGLQAAPMPSWYDVDDAASLRRLVGELFGDRFPNKTPSEVPGFPAPATRAWLSMALDGGLAGRLGFAGLEPPGQAR